MENQDDKDNTSPQEPRSAIMKPLDVKIDSNGTSNASGSDAQSQGKCKDQNEV